MSPIYIYIYIYMCVCVCVCVCVSSYIAQYPVLELLKMLYTLLPWQICSIKHHLNFSGKYPAMLKLMCEGCSYKYPPLSISTHSMWSEKTCPRFHMAAQDSNWGPLSEESETVPLNHCALQLYCVSQLC